MLKKLISITLIIFCIFTTSCTTKLESVKENINDKNIELATEDYKKLKEDEKSQVDEIIKELMGEQYQLFIDGKISGIDSMAEVLRLKKFDGVLEYAEDAIKKINKLNNSRECFKKGQEQEKATNFDMAIDAYKEVNESDSENYKIAQQKISELQIKVDEANKKESEEQLAKEKLENNKYEIVSTSIIPTMMGINDGIQVLVQNNTDVAVKKISIGFFIYDSNGLPIKFGILAGGDLYLAAGDTNANIMPGETYGSDLVVNTYLDTGTVGYVNSRIIEVVDYDGKKWTNSSFSQWYLDNYDKKYE